MAGRGDYGFSVYPELSLVPGLAFAHRHKSSSMTCSKKRPGDFTEAYVTGQMVSKNYPLSKRFF